MKIKKIFLFSIFVFLLAFLGNVSFVSAISLPTVGDVTLKSISGDSASISSPAIWANGVAISGSGIVWSTSTSPMIDLSTKTTHGYGSNYLPTGQGAPGEQMTGLALNTTYYIRGYATNVNGEVGYSSQDLEIKTGLPDLIFTLSDPDPTTDKYGHYYFSGLIKNIGKAVAFAPISNRLQSATLADGKGTRTTDVELRGVPLVNSFEKSNGISFGGRAPFVIDRINPGGSQIINGGGNFIYGGNGDTSSYRVCTDQKIERVTESDESDKSNCTPWINVLVKLVPRVDLIAKPTGGAIGLKPSLTWSIGNAPASSCTATGDWSGPKSIAGGTEPVGPLNTARVYTYKLICTGKNGDSDPAIATVTVCSADTTWNATNEKCESSSGDPSGTITASNCLIGPDSNHCDSTVVWDTINSANHKSDVTTFDHISINKTKNTGTTTYPITKISNALATREFYLYNDYNSGALHLALATATANCDPNRAKWDDSKKICVALPSYIDLVASATTPTTTKADQDTTFTSKITNNGNVGTGASFYNLFQVSTLPNGNRVISSEATDIMMSALGSGKSDDASYVKKFDVGTYYVRFCADKKNIVDATGYITEKLANGESGEDNNCGSWTTINVTDPNADASVWTPWTIRDNCPSSGGKQNRSCVNQKTRMPATGCADDFYGQQTEITYTVDNCPKVLSLTVKRNGNIVPDNGLIPYESRVNVIWTSNANSKTCSCIFEDTKGNKGSCGKELNPSSPYISLSLKRDTNYTVVCKDEFGTPSTKSSRVIVDKLSPGYIEQ